MENGPLNLEKTTLTNQIVFNLIVEHSSRKDLLSNNPNTV